MGRSGTREQVEKSCIAARCTWLLSDIKFELRSCVESVAWQYDGVARDGSHGCGLERPSIFGMDMDDDIACESIRDVEHNFPVTIRD